MRDSVSVLAPLSHARIDVWQANAATTTNEGGLFALDSLPAGTRTVEVRAIGAAPVLKVVDFVAGQLTQVDVTLERAVLLDKVETRAELAYSKPLAMFEQHKRSAAGGFFVRPISPDGHTAQTLITLARAGAGIEVTRDPHDHRWYVHMRQPGNTIQGSSGGKRTPQIFMNGLNSLLDFDDIINGFGPTTILGLEVYTHFGEVPRDYPVDPLSACGVIAIWTRPADSPPAKPDASHPDAIIGMHQQVLFHTPRRVIGSHHSKCFSAAGVHD